MNYVREAREFLESYRDYEKANENLRNKLKDLNTRLEGYKPIDYSGMPHGSGDAEPDDKLCNMIFERDKTKECLLTNIREVNKCEHIINNLSVEEKKILMMTYVDNNGETPETYIMKELNMSRRTYYRYKGHAIRKLARQLFGIKAS